MTCSDFSGLHAECDRPVATKIKRTAMDVAITTSVMLRSNGFVLADGAARLGRLQRSDPSQHVSQLRAHFDAHGYLWLKNFLPRDEVIAFRQHVFAAFIDTG